MKVRSNLKESGTLIGSYDFPFSPNGDQHQISPCNINAQLIAKVSRIKEMITRVNSFDI